MRALFVWLVVLCAAGPAAAQPAAGLEPLPSGPALIGWVRQRLAEALEGVTRLEPGSRPSLVVAETDSPDLPRFTISVAEEPEEREPLVFARSFVSSFSESCGPLRGRGELNEGLFAFGIYVLDCPRIGAGGLHIWIMTYKDGDRSQLVALSAELTRAAAIDARGDRVARAVGIRLYPSIRTLAEALVVADALSGSLDRYDPARMTLPDPTRAALKVDGLIQTGRPGTYEIEVRSCNSIRLREVEDEGRRLVREGEIDLQRLVGLVTRAGPNLSVQAGAYGEQTNFPNSGEPLHRPIDVDAGLFLPDTPWHGPLDAYLQAWERFCQPGATAGSR